MTRISFKQHRYPTDVSRYGVWLYFRFTLRPHSSLGYRGPAPEAVLPAAFMPPYAQGVAP